jgi:branched-chain amino acid transport system permease protein
MPAVLRSRGFVLMAAVFALAACLPFAAPVYYVQFATKALIMALMAMSLNLVVGFGGMVSLCHAAFFGISGYVLAMLTGDSEPASLLLSLPVAVGASALAALAIGALSLRTRGIYFIMVTLAFGEMLFYFFHDTAIGGGSDGRFIYFKPELTIGKTLLLDLDKPRVFYWTALAALALAGLLVAALVRSSFGTALMAARDNERRALALGFPVFRVRLTAFVISGALAGVAGYLAAAQFGFVAPQMLGWHLSATVLVMVVLGGLGTVFGPVVGALAIFGLEEVLKTWIDHWKLAKGLIVIALVLALPGGLGQLAALLWPRPAEDEATGRKAAVNG